MLKKVFIFPIRIYQLFISPLIGGHRSCRFTPTCSSYAIDSINEFGVIKGIFRGFLRILRCNPWGGSGFDPVDNKLKKQ
ncbi:MAG: putative membrane protein insertion efficiency factor [Lentimonas sp.]|jgi:putative membrane protein insertion efficiency factor